MSETRHEHKTIFFDEGPGFVYIKHLGSGAYGDAILVRCIKDLKLYVRKEAKQPVENADIYRASFESAKIRHIKNVYGIAKPAGHIIYKHIKGGLCYEVSYWSYCPGGTLCELINKYSKLDSSMRPEIPGRWLGAWIFQMLSTLFSIHERGVAHGDGHWENWFVRRPTADAPEIVLGDWDCAIRKSYLEDDKAWDRIQITDFEYFESVWRSIRSLVPLTRGANAIYHKIQDALEHCENFRNLAQLRAALWDIRTEGLVLSEYSPDPTDEQNELISIDHDNEPFCTEISVKNMMEDKRFDAMRCFRSVAVDASSGTLHVVVRASVHDDWIKEGSGRG